jgi:L-amino acid N-acyltransferase YncA
MRLTTRFSLLSTLMPLTIWSRRTEVSVERESAPGFCRESPRRLRRSLSFGDSSRSSPNRPPAVHTLRAYELKDGDPIFDSLRADYPDFDAWLQRCKREHREAWVIQPGAGAYVGICIIKPEQSGEFALRGKVLKLSTFKIAEDQRGFGLGELLLKAAFNYAVVNGYDHMYLTTFPKHAELITLMEDFGFESDQAVTEHGEIVLKKHLKPAADADRISALDFNVRYGPFALKVRDVPAFVVPILPRFHAALFPEAEVQLELAPGRYTFGNSIRKAYLCNAAIRSIVLVREEGCAWLEAQLGG